MCTEISLWLKNIMCEHPEKDLEGRDLGILQEAGMLSLFF